MFEPTGQGPEVMNLPPVVSRIENQTEAEPAPICVLVVGMAGSGKTTLMSQLQQSTVVVSGGVVGTGTTTNNNNDKSEDNDNDNNNNDNEGEDEKEISVVDDDDDDDDDNDDDDPSKMPAYAINLDPATLDVPYSPSIDIRDTVDYKQVMAQHKLGPNGAIMTSLNLYATKFDQVIRILEQRADNHRMSKYLLVDTPGQIEAFTWSASGQILSESLASTFPTVLVFVVDTVRCANSPNTFMSNMLYACSMYYRTRLPLVICFNKTDVVSSEFAMEWMKDFDSFQEALDNARSSGTGGTGGFYDSLTRSLSLVLDEFYNAFSKNAVGVSAITGDGISEFWEKIESAAKTDFMDYIEDLKHRIQEQEAKKKAIARLAVKRMQRDVVNNNDE